jgi:hypothetical protein
LGLHVALVDTDAAAALGVVTISDVPSQYFVLSDGNSVLLPNESGDYIVAASQLPHLALHPVTIQPDLPRSRCT